MVGEGLFRAVEEEVLVPDDAIAEAEHECKAERPEQDGAQAGVDDAFLQDVDDLAGSGKAGFEHHEAGLHEEHQERSHQHPCRVDTVDGTGHLSLHVVGVRQAGGVGHGAHDPRPERHDGVERHAEAEQFAAEKRDEEFSPVPISQPRLQGQSIHAIPLSLGEPTVGSAGNVGVRDFPTVSALFRTDDQRVRAR